MKKLCLALLFVVLFCSVAFCADRYEYIFKDSEGDDIYIDAQLIAKGTTEPECGPCKKEYNSSHIDWWIYKDKSPEKYFKVVEENV